MYQPLEQAGWRRLEVERPCCVVGRTRHSDLQGKGAVSKRQMRIECLWLCPKTQARLKESLQSLQRHAARSHPEQAVGNDASTVPVPNAR